MKEVEKPNVVSISPNEFKENVDKNTTAQLFFSIKNVKKRADRVPVSLLQRITEFFGRLFLKRQIRSLRCGVKTEDSGYFEITDTLEDFIVSKKKDGEIKQIRINPAAARMLLKFLSSYVVKDGMWDRVDLCGNIALDVSCSKRIVNFKLTDCGANASIDISVCKRKVTGKINHLTRFITKCLFI